MEYTDIRYSDIPYVYWFWWVPEQHNWGTGMVSKWIVWGRAVSCLHNQATQSQHNWLLAMEYTDIRYSGHYYVYWFCELPELEKPGDGLVSKWIVLEGRGSLILHNQAPNLNTLDFLWWNTWTSGTVSINYVYWSVSARQHNWRTMVSKWIVWGESSLMLT